MCACQRAYSTLGAGDSDWFCFLIVLNLFLGVYEIASLCKQNKGITLIQLDCDATTYLAFTRENCIIKSLNFNMLANRIRGTSYGDAKYWPLIKMINYVDMLLYHLYRDFLGKEPNVLYSSDVVLKPGVLGCSNRRTWWLLSPWFSSSKRIRTDGG